jgi:hypothetical protein
MASLDSRPSHARNRLPTWRPHTQIISSATTSIRPKIRKRDSITLLQLNLIRASLPQLRVLSRSRPLDSPGVDVPRIRCILDPKITPVINRIRNRESIHSCLFGVEVCVVEKCYLRRIECSTAGEGDNAAGAKLEGLRVA